MKKVQVEQEGVRIIVDFRTVWSFMWRWIVLVFGIGFVIGILTTIFS